MREVAIIGCGYTGLRLARRWRALGAEVRGYAVRPESLSAIAAAGARAVPIDLDRDGGLIGAAGQIVYYCVPPPPTGRGDARLERFLLALSGRPHRLIYLGTTGVYGDLQGAWVDENTPPNPKTERAARRLVAEAALRRWAERGSVSWCILRIAGIYGPGRLPLERLRRGTPAITPEEATPGNRIHVEDLADACVAAGTATRANRRIYNVADGNDASLTDYLLRVARLAHLPPPPLVSRAEAERTLSPAEWSFLAESRRIDNRRMLAELGVTLAYADLDAGIRASLSAA